MQAEAAVALVLKLHHVLESYARPNGVLRHSLDENGHAIFTLGEFRVTVRLAGWKFTRSQIILDSPAGRDYFGVDVTGSIYANLDRAILYHCRGYVDGLEAIRRDPKYLENIRANEEDAVLHG